MVVLEYRMDLSCLKVNALETKSLIINSNKI